MAWSKTDTRPCDLSNCCGYSRPGSNSRGWVWGRYGHNKASLMTVWSTKLSDFVLNKLCWKGKSNSMSWIVSNFSGRELDLDIGLFSGRELKLEKGLLLPWLFVRLLFLSNFSRLSKNSVGLGFGCPLVKIILGARYIENLLHS